MFVFILIDLFIPSHLINGQDINWQHLVGLYKAQRGADCATFGLSILPKLKWEHIELNSYSKMRVDLAAKVISI